MIHSNILKQDFTKKTEKVNLFILWIGNIIHNLDDITSFLLFTLYTERRNYCSVCRLKPEAHCVDDWTPLIKHWAKLNLYGCLITLFQQSILLHQWVICIQNLNFQVQSPLLRLVHAIMTCKCLNFFNLVRYANYNIYSAIRWGMNEVHLFNDKFYLNKFS